jgi:hypothetical protein
MQKQYWILMGDIVGSRKKEGAILMKVFDTLISFLNTNYKNQLLSPLTITLGDEFQGVVKNRKAGEEMIIAAEEWLLNKTENIKIRFLLHYGKIETPINPEIAYGMLGKGLSDARDGLNAMKKEKDRFKVFGIQDSDNINDHFILFQSIIDGWSVADRKLVADFLKEGDYKKVAEMNKKDASLMWKRERSLKIREYKIIKELILKD